jgi:hypothetical protein
LALLDVLLCKFFAAPILAASAPTHTHVPIFSKTWTVSLRKESVLLKCNLGSGNYWLRSLVAHASCLHLPEQEDAPASRPCLRLECLVCSFCVCFFCATLMAVRRARLPRGSQLSMCFVGLSFAGLLVLPGFVSDCPEVVLCHYRALELFSGRGEYTDANRRNGEARPPKFFLSVEFGRWKCSV